MTFIGEVEGGDGGEGVEKPKETSEKIYGSYNSIEGEQLLTMTMSLGQ